MNILILSIPILVSTVLGGIALLFEHSKFVDKFVDKFIDKLETKN